MLRSKIERCGTRSVKRSAVCRLKSVPSSGHLFSFPGFVRAGAFLFAVVLRGGGHAVGFSGCGRYPCSSVSRCGEGANTVVHTGYRLCFVSIAKCC